MFYPRVFPKSCRTSVPSAKQSASCNKPYQYLEVAILFVYHSSVLFFTTGVGVASMVLLTTSLDTAGAQTPTISDPGQVSVKTKSQVKVLFVNPSVGDDKVGNGGERTPLKTITQALQLANSNTVIILSKGTYSSETGERFPLMLKPGVSIQGDQGSKGHNTVITGGGDYLSRTFGGKNVAVVGADQAGLTGVTVTNSNPRGYGLWIEYSSPVVEENTFTGSTQDGIAVTGNSQPSIRNNYFYQNRANGITITGHSRADVQKNVFQQTGFGINIAQNAEPMLVGNQILSNRCGIVVQAHAHPILRSNLIQDSTEDGLVAIAQATPDLGSPSEPGGNQFRNNSRYDINAKAAQQTIAAYGNTLNSDRITGKVDANGITATEATSIEEQGDKGKNFVSVSPPTQQLSVSFTNRRIAATSNNTISGPLNSQLLPIAPLNQKKSTNHSTGFPTPSSLTGYGSQPLGAKPTSRQQVASTGSSTQIPSDQSNTPQLNYVQMSPVAIEFTARKSEAHPVASAPLPTLSSPRPSFPVVSAPLSTLNSPRPSFPVVSAPLQPIVPAPLPILSSPSPSFPVVSTPVPTLSNQGQQLPVLQSAPVGNSFPLPVPNSNVPSDNTSQMRRMPGSQTATVKSDGSPSQRVASVGQIDLRYRVVVTVGTQKDQKIVKFIAPRAFRTVWHGQEVMQVGVFGSRYNANHMVKILHNKGLRAVVEPIN